MTLVLQLLSNGLFRTVLLLPTLAIAVDTVTAVLLAIRSGNFSTIKLGDFVQSNLLPYVSLVGSVLFGVGLNLPAAAVGIAGSAAYAAFMAAQLASIRLNIAKLTGLPDSVVGSIVDQGAVTIDPTFTPGASATNHPTGPVAPADLTVSDPSAPVSVPPAA